MKKASEYLVGRVLYRIEEKRWEEFFWQEDLFLALGRVIEEHQGEWKAQKRTHLLSVALWLILEQELKKMKSVSVHGNMYKTLEEEGLYAMVLKMLSLQTRGKKKSSAEYRCTMGVHPKGDMVFVTPDFGIGAMSPWGVAPKVQEFWQVLHRAPKLHLGGEVHRERHFVNALGVGSSEYMWRLCARGVEPRVSKIPNMFDNRISGQWKEQEYGHFKAVCAKKLSQAFPGVQQRPVFWSKLEEHCAQIAKVVCGDLSEEIEDLVGQEFGVLCAWLQVEMHTKLVGVRHRRALSL